MAENFPLNKGQTVFLPLACPCLSMHSLRASQAFKNYSLIFYMQLPQRNWLQVYDSTFTSPFIYPKLYTPAYLHT